MEGHPGRDSLPEDWIAASNTPDVFPGVFGIFKPASNGRTYVGLHSGPTYSEGITQHLTSALQGGSAYTFSLDLAFAPKYLYQTCYGNLVIYGGNTPGDTAEVLWRSGLFTDTSWQKYNPILMPSKNYAYLSFWAIPSEVCDKSSFGCALLMDNCSNIRQLMKMELTASPACKRSNTGSVAVKVKTGKGPYEYLWTPGNYTTAQVDHLAAGEYTVTVNAPNGVSGSGKVIVPSSGFTTDIAVKTSACYGENTNEIKLDVAGGVPPYSFYFNGIKTPGDPVYSQLNPGYYAVTATDAQCADTYHVTIREPERLTLQQAIVTSTSCSATSDGKIILQASGGTPPYLYRLMNEHWQPDSIIPNLKADYYQFEIKDSQGCNLNGNASITAPYQNCLVVMPTAFSPNGDGRNDLFRPKVYDQVKNYELSVYNRWGGLVFRTADPAVGWDGGQQVEGAFIYLCTFNDRNNERRELSGSVMLVK